MYFRQHHNLREKEKGFSIVELIVVVVIVSVLAGITLINLTKIIETQRLKSISLYLSDYLNSVRKDAIQNDYPCKIEIKNTSSTVLPNTISIVNLVESTPPDPATDGQCFNTTVNRINLNTLPDAPKNLKICSAQIPSSINVSTQVVSDLLTFETNDECNFADPPNPPSSPSSSLTFTPSGLTTNSLVVKIKSPEVQRLRCILVISPLGIIRNGVQTSNETCDFTNFN